MEVRFPIQMVPCPLYGANVLSCHDFCSAFLARRAFFRFIFGFKKSFDLCQLSHKVRNRLTCCLPAAPALCKTTIKATIRLVPFFFFFNDYFGRTQKGLEKQRLRSPQPAPPRINCHTQTTLLITRRIVIDSQMVKFRQK